MPAKSRKPRTEAQREASRRNGAKSKGPTSAAGKARSSLNATTHGITAKAFLLANENPAALDELRDAYYRRFQPVDRAEADLVDEMIMARWRIRRYVPIESSLLDIEMIRQQPDLEHSWPGISSPMRCALAFSKLANDDNALALIARYEPRLQRAYKTAYETLLEMQANRPDPLPQNEPEPAPNPQPDQPVPLPSAPAEPTQPEPTPQDIRVEMQPSAPPLPQPQAIHPSAAEILSL